MVKAKIFLYVKKFDGFPKDTDFKLVEEELPPLKNGEFLVEAVYISIDAYMRSWGAELPLGKPFMMGQQVAKIIESKNPNFPVGKYVLGEFGWRSHTISNGRPLTQISSPPRILSESQGLPLSYYLGILGVTGNTAYFGFLELCQPKPGDTVVVTSAAGAVGSTVGQIAKIKGCKVIGIVGSEKKGKWITEELGFDNYVNYKDPDFEKKLEAAVPNGIDCYFDNVGGQLATTIMSKMNTFGRVAACGVLSEYNDKSIKASPVQWHLVGKQLKMEGFIVSRWRDRWMEGLQQIGEWLKQGKLKYKETVTDGFENMFQAFLNLMKGDNIGKAVVKA